MGSCFLRPRQPKASRSGADFIPANRIERQRYRREVRMVLCLIRASGSSKSCAGDPSFLVKTAISPITPSLSLPPTFKKTSIILMSCSSHAADQFPSLFTGNHRIGSCTIRSGPNAIASPIIRRSHLPATTSFATRKSLSNLFPNARRPLQTYGPPRRRPCHRPRR